MGINCGSQVVLCEYPIRLDTYEGCSHGCRYCFARMKRDIDVVKPLHCAEQVRKFVGGGRTAETNWCDWRIPLHWGGLSDPFQPAELEHRCTLEALEVLRDSKYPFIVSTKGRLVAEEPYLSMLSECEAVVQISMTSPQLDRLEPGAPTFDERIAIAAKVAHRVRRVVARVQPYMPECRAALLDALPRLKEAGVHGVTLEGMKFKRRHPGLVKVGGDWCYPEAIDVHIAREGEERWMVIGRAHAALWSVVVTYRGEDGETVRIISARRAAKREADFYARNHR